MRGLLFQIAILALVPAAFGLPKLLQHWEREAETNAPRAYNMYEITTRYEHYTYGGYGPQPTVSSSPTLISSSSTSDNSGGGTMTDSVTSISIVTPLFSPSAAVSQSSTKATSSSAGTSSSYHGTKSKSSTSSKSPMISTVSTNDGISFTNSSPTLSIPQTYPTAPPSAYSLPRTNSSHSVTVPNLSSASILSFTTSTNRGTNSNTSSSTRTILLHASSTHWYHTQLSSFHPSNQVLSSATSSITSTSSNAESAGPPSVSRTHITPSTPLPSSYSTAISSSTSVSLTSSYGGVMTSYASKSTSLSLTQDTATHVKPQKCNRDNCLRQLIATPSVGLEFCAEYTAALNTETTALPILVSQCRYLPSRISSACSCIATLTHSYPVSSSSSQSRSTSSLGGISTTPVSSNVQVTSSTVTRGFSSLSPGSASSPTTISSYEYPNTTLSSLSISKTATASLSEVLSTTTYGSSATPVPYPGNNSSGTVSPTGSVYTSRPPYSSISSLGNGVQSSKSSTLSSTSVPFPYPNSTSSNRPIGTDTTIHSTITRSITITVPALSSSATPAYPVSNTSVVVGSSGTFPPPLSTGASSRSDNSGVETSSIPYPMSNSTTFILTTGTGSDYSSRPANCTEDHTFSTYFNISSLTLTSSYSRSTLETMESSHASTSDTYGAETSTPSEHIPLPTYYASRPRPTGPASQDHEGGHIRRFLPFGYWW